MAPTDEERALLRVHPPFPHQHAECTRCGWVSIGYTVDAHADDVTKWEIVSHYADAHPWSWSGVWSRISLRMLARTMRGLT